MIARFNLLKAFQWSVVNSSGSLIIRLGSLAILSRILGPAEYGLYNVGMAFVVMSAAVGQLGIPTNLMAQSDFRWATARLGLLLAVLSGAGLAVGGVLLLRVSAPGCWKEYEGIILPFALLSVLQIALNTTEAIIRRELRMRLIAANELFAAAVGNGLVAIGLALAGMGATALIIGQLVYCLQKMGGLVFAVRKELFGSRELSGAAVLLEGSMSIVVAEAANMATVHVQRPIVGAGLGIEEAGLWSRVYQIILIELSVLVQPLDHLVVPIFSRLRGETSHFASALAAALQVVAVTTLPVALLTLVWAPLVVPVLFGRAWVPLIVPLQIGSIILFFRGVERVLLSTSRAAGTMQARASIQLTQLVIIVGAILATLQYGLVAVSFAYIGSLALGSVLSLTFMRHTTGLSAPLAIGAIAPGVAIAGAPLLCGLALSVATGQPLHAPVPLAVTTLGTVAAVAVAVIARRRVLHPLVAASLSSFGRRSRTTGDQGS